MLKKLLGQSGEKQAEQYLKSLGYKIIKRNFRCKFGEIDLITENKTDLVFIEVKTRSSRDFGLPEEAVNARKLEHIKKAAEHYLSNNPTTLGQRIEVISVEKDLVRLIKVD